MAAVIGYGNLIDTAMLGGTFTDLANLQTRYLAQKATSEAQVSSFLPLSQTTRDWLGMTTLGTDVYACVYGGDIYKQTSLGGYIDIDLGTAKSIGVIAVIAHTQASGTIRVQGGASAGSGSAYDSTALAIYSGSDYAITFEPASARYWRITWSEQMSCGRVFIGPRFKPANNFDWGPSFARESDSVVGKALSGMEFGDKRPSRRVWRGAFSWLTPAEADAFDTLMASADITDEVYWIEEETDTTYRGKRWFLGRFRTLSPIEYPYLNVHKVGVEIGELL